MTLEQHWGAVRFLLRHLAKMGGAVGVWVRYIDQYSNEEKQAAWRVADIPPKIMFPGMARTVGIQGTFNLRDPNNERENLTGAINRIRADSGLPVYHIEYVFESVDLKMQANGHYSGSIACDIPDNFEDMIADNGLPYLFEIDPEQNPFADLTPDPDAAR